MGYQYLDRDGLRHLVQGLKPHTGLKPEEFAALAKQGEDSGVTLTTIDEKIGDLQFILDAINGQSLDDIVEKYVGDIATSIDEITGEEN